MTLGEIIKEYRAKHNMSMDAFSERSGISKAYIGVLEKNQHPQTGKAVAPSIHCIKQAADGMGMDFDVLFSMLDGDVTLPKDEPIRYALTDREIEIIEKFRALDYTQQERIEERMDEMLEQSKKESLGDRKIS